MLDILFDPTGWGGREGSQMGMMGRTLEVEFLALKRLKLIGKWQALYLDHNLFLKIKCK